MTKTEKDTRQEQRATQVNVINRKLLSFVWQSISCVFGDVPKVTYKSYHSKKRTTTVHYGGASMAGFTKERSACNIFIRQGQIVPKPANFYEDT